GARAIRVSGSWRLNSCSDRPKTRFPILYVAACPQNITRSPKRRMRGLRFRLITWKFGDATLVCAASVVFAFRTLNTSASRLTFARVTASLFEIRASSEERLSSRNASTAGATSTEAVPSGPSDTCRTTGNGLPWRPTRFADAISSHGSWYEPLTLNCHRGFMYDPFARGASAPPTRADRCRRASGS